MRLRVREQSSSLPLAAAAAIGGLACLAAPFLVWLARDRRPVACGWTCYVPMGGSGHGGPPHWATVTGRTGFGVSPGLGIVLLTVAVGGLAIASLVARGRAAPVPVGAVAAGVGALGAVAFAWSLVVVLRRTAGDTWVLARHGGALQPATGPGAWAAVLGAALAVGVSILVLVQARRTGSA